MEHSSARAARVLNRNGYHASALKGGFNGWVKAGLPLEDK